MGYENKTYPLSSVCDGMALPPATPMLQGTHYLRLQEVWQGKGCVAMETMQARFDGFGTS